MKNERLKTIADIQPQEDYAQCEFLPLIGISNTHFKKLSRAMNIMPHTKELRGSKPFWTGADILRFNTMYN